MSKTKILIITIGILLLLSSVCFAQSQPTLEWDDIFEKFIGNYNNGTLDTTGAILTDKIPKIIAICLIAVSAGMLAFGELSSTATTLLRMIFGIAVVTHLGAYFGYMFSMPDTTFIDIAEPKPDPNSGDFLGLLMMDFIYKCQKGAEYIYPICLKLLVLGWAVDVGFHLILKLEDDIIKYMITNALKMAMHIFLVTNWILGMGIAHAVFASFEGLGYRLGGGENSFLMPDDILGNAFKIIESTWDSLSKISFMTSPAALLVSVIIFLIIIICIFIVSATILVVRVEFWVMALFGMIAISASMFKPTKYLLEKSVSSLIHYATKASVVAFITAIIEPILTNAVEKFAADTDLLQVITVFIQLAFSIGIMGLLVYKLPNIAQAISSGQPALNGSDLYTQMKAIPNKAMSMKGKWDAASRMAGGSSSKGAAGFLSNIQSIGAQAARGDFKGAGKTALNYGKGTLGTAKNLAQMGIQGGLLKSYYDAQQEAMNTREKIARMDTQKKVGNLKNNTSPNEEKNAQNAYIRQKMQNSINPKDNYNYELEKAEQEITREELPKPLNTNIPHYYHHNDHNDDNNRNNDINIYDNDTNNNDTN